MNTPSTPYIHRPTVFDGGDLSWVATSLAPLAEVLGTDCPWGLTLDVYADDQGNFYPIFDEPSLLVADDHPLFRTTRGRIGLADLTGDLRLPALETLAALAKASGSFIELMELRGYDLLTHHQVETRTGCYWRFVLTPSGCVAVVPEDTDGYVERNTALGLDLGGGHWENAQRVGLGTLAVETPRSAHEVLVCALKAQAAAAWCAALSGRIYTGEADGLVWGEPANTLKPA